jgi:hypothetical protein
MSFGRLVAMRMKRKRLGMAVQNAQLDLLVWVNRNERLPKRVREGASVQ